MTVFGISMVLDEADVIGATLSHMLTQVDEIIVADNSSTDGTREILDSFPITLLDDPEIGYYQSRKLTALARIAADQGADWIVPFDADEVWYSPFGTIKDVLNDIEPQWLVASADLYNHVSSSEDDQLELNPVKRIGWRRREMAPLSKVACRYREDLGIEQGNHAARYDGGATIKSGLLVVRHFPYRSPEQMIRKSKNGAAAYAATDLPETEGAHWRGYGVILEDKGEEAFVGEVYRKWYYLDKPREDPNVIFDPAPYVV